MDRQCGVIITPNNHPCTRSLTCKIHAMGAKRSVEGRSQPFNDLLAAYQKKGIGRPQGIHNRYCFFSLFSIIIIKKRIIKKRPRTHPVSLSTWYDE